MSMAAASASSRNPVVSGDVNPATLKSMAAEVVTLAATAESSSQSQLQQQQQLEQRTAAAAAVSDLQIGSSNVVSSFALSQSSNLSKSMRAWRFLQCFLFNLFCFYTGVELINIMK